MNPDIGGKIRQLRLERSMTQEQLAQRLNLSAQAVSKWENGVTLPDIQLLPELSTIFGITIDELFSVSDDTRFDRIEDALDNMRFIPDGEFERIERWLLQKRSRAEDRPRATLLLAQLYNKRAEEYRDRAKPLAREALRLNPDVNAAHNAVFDAEGGPVDDWNAANHRELIDFYKSFVDGHPQDPRALMWLMNLLLADGRTAEARETLKRMRALRDDYRCELYSAWICQAEYDLEGAMKWYAAMRDREPENWVVWSSCGDAMARLCRYDEAIAYYRKAMPLREKPRFCDCEECIAHILEIQGDYAGAAQMQREIIALLREDWDVTEGELVEFRLREIARLERRAQEP